MLATAFMLPLGQPSSVEAASATVTNITNPDAYSCGQSGFITFEALPNFTNLSVGSIDGVQFTTTGGHTWLVGDFAAGGYNGKYPSGGYMSQGTHWAWLGTAQGAGRIDFVNGPASYFSLLVSSASPVSLDGYDSSGNLLTTAGPSGANTGTGRMAELKITRDTSDLAYVIVHDSGNLFLVDSLCTDAPGVPHAENSAPTADAGGPYSVNEGSTVQLSGTGTDADLDDILTFSWSPATNLNDATLEDPTYSGVDDTIDTLTLSVSDGTVSTTDTAQVTVLNVAPTATFNASSPINEGGSISLSLTSPSDPSGADVTAGFTYAFDCGSGYASFGSSSSAFCPTNDNGTPTVKGKIMDKDGGVTEYTSVATINNVAPTAGAITAPIVPTLINTLINTSVSFTDPGTADTHTASWNWGDGATSAGTMTESNGSGTATGSHAYTAAGVYTVVVTITDDDGGVDTSTYQYVVIYDPNGGFVTGGGWINSPAGAYRPDPTLTGRANFGFVSRYRPGHPELPVGNTQFQFQTGNMNFHSNAYEWLVIAGPRAQFRGTGTINGTGAYTFIITAIDGQATGGGGIDKFRMKIWDTASNTLVYDNQLGAPDPADPTTAISGGSIVIHR